MKHSKSIFILSAIIIALFCVLGLFSRPYPADDFGFYNAVAEEGFIQAQILMYTQWAGRIFNTFLVYSAALFPLEKVQPFIALFDSVIYTLACLVLVSVIFPALTLFAKLSLSLMVCALTLCFTYSLNETFYWLAGGMTYFVAQVMIVLALALAIKAYRGSRSSFILCMIVLFLNATNLEQPCVFQGVIAFAAMIYFFARVNKRAALMSGAYWLVSVAGFCIMYFAPGTAVRMGAGTLKSPSVFAMIRNGLILAFSMGVMNIFQFFFKPLTYTMLLFLPAIAEKIPPADEKLSRRLRAWHIIAAVSAVSMSMQFIVGAVMYRGLPPRGVSLSLWLMYFTWNTLLIFFYRGRLIHSKGFKNFCAKFRWPVLILSVLVSANFRDCVNNLRIAPEYAAEYDSITESMKAQSRRGEKILTAPRIKARPNLLYWNIEYMSAHENIAKYYGGEKFYIIPEELSQNPEAVKKLTSGNLEPFAELADKGDTEAARIIGNYRDPRNNARNPAAWNPEEAEKYYRIGAENGNAFCMRPLARMVYTKNLPEGIYWLVKAHIKWFRL